jgi:FkbM family methyltransferase
MLKRLRGWCFAILREIFRRAGYRLERLDHSEFLEPLLYRRLHRCPDFFFVQIGANDGVFNDPIRQFVTRHDLAGLVVEPLKDFYEKLVQNYQPYPKVKPVNVAIHESARTMEIHRADPSKIAHLDPWIIGIGSFRKEHHRANAVPDEVMTTETVACITLDELLTIHHVSKVDLLQIDTEGYDYEIINMIDFTRVKPAIIHFEHGLPAGTMTQPQFLECVELLMREGYLLITEPYDAVAYLAEAF